MNSEMLNNPNVAMTGNFEEVRNIISVRLISVFFIQNRKPSKANSWAGGHSITKETQTETDIEAQTVKVMWLYQTVCFHVF